MVKPDRKQYVKHTNEEDRRNALLESKRKYANKPWICETCNITVLRANKTRHMKSKKHIKNECQTCSESVV